MNEALCFFAGANSIFVGDTLLTADNPCDGNSSAGTIPLSLSLAHRTQPFR